MITDAIMMVYIVPLPVPAVASMAYGLLYFIICALISSIYFDKMLSNKVKYQHNLTIRCIKLSSVCNSFSTSIDRLQNRPLPTRRKVGTECIDDDKTTQSARGTCL